MPETLPSDRTTTAPPTLRKPNSVDRLERLPARREQSGAADPLPENTLYVDRGCGNGCTRSLECPFPRCQYDDPPVSRHDKRRRRDKELIRARIREGLSVSALAKRFNVGTRTVYRALQSVGTAHEQAEPERGEE